MNPNTERMSTTKRVTRAESKARTRQRLLDSGREVFTRKGFVAATVEEIAEAAGFSRGAFYANFKDKHELFWALVEAEDASSFDAMAEALDTADGDELQRIEHWFGGLLALRPLQRAYEEVMANAGEADRRRFAEMVAANRARIVPMLVAQAESRGIELPVSYEHMAALILGVADGLAQQRQLDEDAVPLSLFADAFEFLWVGAINRAAAPSAPPAASDRRRS
jgi:AcrR family transcriptional regulator